MKTILLLILMTTATTASAASYYGNDQYSRSVRAECEKETASRTRTSRIINHRAAEQCFSDVLQIHRQNRMDDSYSAANEAYADYLEEATKTLRYNRRNR